MRMDSPTLDEEIQDESFPFNMTETIIIETPTPNEKRIIPELSESIVINSPKTPTPDEERIIPVIDESTNIKRVPKRKRDENDEEREDVEREFDRNPKSRKLQETRKDIGHFELATNDFQKDLDRLKKSGAKLQKVVSGDDSGFGGFYRSGIGNPGTQVVAIDGFNEIMCKINTFTGNFTEEIERFTNHYEESECIICHKYTSEANRFNSECCCNSIVCNECAVKIIREKGGYLCPTCNSTIY
jgi:hypothetical protein